jgi:hypothetical protein
MIKDHCKQGRPRPAAKTPVSIKSNDLLDTFISNKQTSSIPLDQHLSPFFELSCRLEAFTDLESILFVKMSDRHELGYVTTVSDSSFVVRHVSRYVEHYIEKMLLEALAK